MVGGDDYASARSTSPPRASASPAPLQAVHPRGGAHEGHHARLHLDLAPDRLLRREDQEGPLHGVLRRRQLRGRLLGRDVAANATAFSDNSVFAQLGSSVGTKKIAHLARGMGSDGVSNNLAMTLGGLKEGVTVLDMAHAYESFAQRGRFVYGDDEPGRVEASELTRPTRARGHPAPSSRRRPRPPGRTAQRLEGHPQDEPGPAQDLGRRQRLLDPLHRRGAGTAGPRNPRATFVAGKTGTTENYGDAWFVGWTDDITVAVWVGYPDELRPMETEFRASPSPAAPTPPIWKTFVERAIPYAGYGEEDEDDEDPTPAGDHGAAHAGTYRRSPRPTDPGGARRPRRPVTAGGARADDARAPRGAESPRPRRRRPGPSRRPSSRPRATAAARGAPAASLIPGGRGRDTAATPRARTATAARPPW